MADAYVLCTSRRHCTAIDEAWLPYGKLIIPLMSIRRVRVEAVLKPREVWRRLRFLEGVANTVNGIHV